MGSMTSNDVKMEKTIAKELETNTCPICYELMLPPINSPILLFPCGHTFCNKCLKDHSKKNGFICPLCRKPIKSQAPNISLQNLICTFTNNKHLLDKVNVDDLYAEENQQNNKNETDEENVEKYEENLKICKLRYKIVNSEKLEVEEKFNRLQKDQQTKKDVLTELERKKESVTRKLEKLQAELVLINDFMEQTHKEETTLEKEMDTTITTLELLNNTLEPIEKEKVKYELFIKGLKSNKNATPTITRKR